MFKQVKKFVVLLMTLILIMGIFLLIIKSRNVSQTIIEQAKEIVIVRAQQELGFDCNIVVERLDSKNDICWIGCVNSKNTHAIMYIAKKNKLTEMWLVNIFSEREGSNAASLFSANHSMLVH